MSMNQYFILSPYNILKGIQGEEKEKKKWGALLVYASKVIVNQNQTRKVLKITSFSSN